MVERSSSEQDFGGEHPTIDHRLEAKDIAVDKCVRYPYLLTRLVESWCSAVVKLRWGHGGHGPLAFQNLH